MPTMTMTLSETGEGPARPRGPGWTVSGTGPEQRAAICCGALCGGCQAPKGEAQRGAATDREQGSLVKRAMHVLECVHAHVRAAGS